MLYGKFNVDAPPRRPFSGASARTIASATSMLALGVSLAGEVHAGSVTVNPVQATTYNFTPGNNPITFGSATNINSTADAADGDTSAIWTVTNNGALTGLNGVDLQPSSTVTNAGTIAGTSGSGIVLETGGSVTNQTGGTITGATDGIVGSSNGAGTNVDNAGSITGGADAGVTITNYNYTSTVTNRTSGAIEGAAYGVFLSGIGDAISNSGTITAPDGQGVVIIGSGSVVNLTGGRIIGSNTGVSIGIAGSGTIINAGTISAAAVGGQGVSISGSGGSMTNQSGGTITGSASGVYVSGFDSSVTNDDMITATNGVGVRFITESIVSSAKFSSVNSGFYLDTFNLGGTLTNAGTITGSTASIEFISAGTNTLILQTGSALNGDAIGSTDPDSTNALVLQGKGAANNAFRNFDTLSVQASGEWALNGVSTIPVTAITSGNLQVGDAAHASAQLTSAVTVDLGGTLSGHGSIVGTVINNGGVVSPGGTIGVLTIHGDYTQSPTGTLSIELSPQTSSTLVVTGVANLDGAIQLVTDPGVYRKGTRYNLLTASTITGFATVTATNGLDFGLSLQSGDLVATVLTGDFAPVGATRNEIAVAHGFNAYPIGVSDFDPVANALIALPTATRQNAALDQLGGEAAADFLTVGRDRTRAFLNGVEDQLAEIDPGLTRASAVWGHAFGGSGSIDGDGGAHGYAARSSGAIVGADRQWGADTSFGAAISYGQTNIALTGLSQSGALDTTIVGLYGEHRSGKLFVDGAADVSYDQGDSKRQIAFGGVDRRADGSFHGMAAGLSITLGERLQMHGGWRVEPALTLIVSHVRQNGYTENGATGADLAVSSRTEDDAESITGGRLSRSIPLGAGALKADARLAWAHDFNDAAPAIGQAFAAAPGSGFGLIGARPGRDSALVGAGLTYSASAKLSFYGRYDGAFDARQTNQSLALGFEYAW